MVPMLLTDSRWRLPGPMSPRNETKGMLHCELLGCEFMEIPLFLESPPQAPEHPEPVVRDSSTGSDEFVIHQGMCGEVKAGSDAGVGQQSELEALSLKGPCAIANANARTRTVSEGLRRRPKGSSPTPHPPGNRRCCCSRRDN